MKFTLLSLLAVMASASPAWAVTPAGVPEGYVVTPFGYYHTSCVQYVGEEDMLKPDEGVVQHPDGSMDSMPACMFAHYTSAREEVGVDAKEPKIKHAWIEDVSTTTKSSYGGLYTEWKVPPIPKSNDGQTVFFFPGLEDYKDVVTIIQPVLGFQSAFDNEWDIASWNCCVKGTVYRSPAIKVKPGDTIAGGIYDNCKAGTLECGSWAIVTEDRTSHKTTVLRRTSNFKQTFNWAFANVLEVYNVVRCSDLPPTDKLTAYDIELENDKFALISSPGWDLSVAKVTPECGYGSHGNATTQTITY